MWRSQQNYKCSSQQHLISECLSDDELDVDRNLFAKSTRRKNTQDFPPLLHQNIWKYNWKPVSCFDIFGENTQKINTTKHQQSLWNMETAGLALFKGGNHVNWWSLVAKRSHWSLKHRLTPDSLARVFHFIAVDQNQCEVHILKSMGVALMRNPKHFTSGKALSCPITLNLQQLNLLATWGQQKHNMPSKRHLFLSLQSTYSLLALLLVFWLVSDPLQVFLKKEKPNICSGMRANQNSECAGWTAESGSKAL